MKKILLLVLIGMASTFSFANGQLQCKQIKKPKNTKYSYHDSEHYKCSYSHDSLNEAYQTVILPFLMDRISRIKCSSMAAYHRWLDEAFHDYRTTTNGWHNPEYHLSC